MFKNSILIDFDARIQRACANLDKGDYEEAYSDFETIADIVEMEKLPNLEGYDIILFNMGFCSYKLGWREDAIRCFNKEIALSKVKEPVDMKNTWFYKAVCHFYESQFQEALTSFTQVIQFFQKPGDADHGTATAPYVWYHMGYCNFELDRYDDAIHCFDQNLSAKAQGHTYREKQTWFFRGRCYERKQQYQQAIECYQKAQIINDPQELNDQILYHMGFCNFQIDKYDDAIGCFDSKIASSVVASSYREKLTWFYKGQCYEVKQEYFKAIDCYQKASIINYPQEQELDDKILYHMGFCNFRIGKHDDAIVFFERKIALKAVADSYSEKLTWIVKALCYEYKERFQEAIDNYSQAILVGKKPAENNDVVLDVDDVFAWYHMGFCSYQLGKYDDAIRFFKQQITGVRFKRETLIFMARSHEYKTEFLEAIDCYQQVIQSSQNQDNLYHDAIYNQAGLYFRMGDHAAAAEVSALVTDVYKQIVHYLPSKLNYTHRLSMRHNVFKIFDVHRNDLVKIAVVKYFAMELRKYGPVELSLSSISSTALSTLIDNYPIMSTLITAVDDMDLDNSVVKAIKRHPSLTTLDCDFCFPTVEMMRILSTASLLTSLTFTVGTQLDDDICAPLCSMTSLRTLNLPNQSLSDVSARELAKATWLRKLDLSGNSIITYAGAVHLLGNRSLTDLDLSHCDRSIDARLLDSIARSTATQQTSLQRIIKERMLSPLVMLILRRHIYSKNNIVDESRFEKLPSDLIKKILLQSIQDFFSELFPKNANSIQGLINFLFANAENLLVLIRQKQPLKIFETVKLTTCEADRQDVRPGISSKHLTYVHTFCFFREPMQIEPPKVIESVPQNKRSAPADDHRPGNTRVRIEPSQS